MADDMLSHSNDDDCIKCDQIVLVYHVNAAGWLCVIGNIRSLAHRFSGGSMRDR